MVEFLLWTLLFLQDKPYWQNKVYTVVQRGQIDAFQYEKKRKQKNRQNKHNIGGEQTKANINRYRALFQCPKLLNWKINNWFMTSD